MLSAAVLVVAAATPDAQTRPRTFAEISAGAIVQQSHYNVSSGLGATGAFAVGRTLTAGIALEGRFSASTFPKPQQITTPGGCLGRESCIYPTVSYVRSMTWGLSGEYAFRLAPEQNVRALVLLGAGERYMRELPYYANDTRPYAEAGIGATFAHLGFRARYQLSATASDLPTWMFPMTLDYRF